MVLVYKISFLGKKLESSVEVNDYLNFNMPEVKQLKFKDSTDFLAATLKR